MTTCRCGAPTEYIGGKYCTLCFQAQRKRAQKAIRRLAAQRRELRERMEAYRSDMEACRDSTKPLEDAGTRCRGCTWRDGDTCTHKLGRGDVAFWLLIRSMIPPGMKRPTAPGWCPLEAYWQLPLWKGQRP